MSSRRAYIRDGFAAVMRKQDGSATRNMPVTPRTTEFSSESAPGPSHPAFDRLEEMRTKELQEDCETLKKGFNKLRDRYTQSVAKVSAMEDELNACRRESTQLGAQVTALQKTMELFCEKCRCTVCFEIYDNPYSLDCRHLFCGICVASSFAGMRNTTCPMCRTNCVAYPQRDFALRDILPLIYSGLGREMPASNFDATIFTRIYAMKEQFLGMGLTPTQAERFWQPMVMEVQQMRGVPVEDVPVDAVIDVDAEMGEENEGSDWELGSGVDSGEDGNGIDGLQGEGDGVEDEEL